MIHGYSRLLQTGKVLNYLLSGDTLTPEQAKTHLKVCNLPVVVHKLRDDGYSIIRTGNQYALVWRNEINNTLPVFGSIWNVLEMAAFELLPASNKDRYILELVLYGKRIFNYGCLSKWQCTMNIRLAQKTFNPGAPYYVRITHIDYKEQKKAA